MDVIIKNSIHHRANWYLFELVIILFFFKRKESFMMRRAIYV